MIHDRDWADLTTRGVLLLYTTVATVAYGTSIRVNGACSLEVFELVHPVICALGAIFGACLSLFMQRYPTCNQENARDLGKPRDLSQHNNPNDGGRCWQQRKQERKRCSWQSSHGELVTHIRDDR